LGDLNILEAEDMPRTTSPKLAVIPAPPEPQGLPTPAGLGAVGADLWQRITASYAFDDPGSIETLRQACLATDRAERCAAAINEHGEMLRVGKTLRANPLLRDEVQFRALAARLLGKLGLDLEPIRSRPGRPSGGLGVR
jgi:hypothetical protein